MSTPYSVANNQSVSVSENTTVQIILSASDVDGDPLPYSIVTGPSEGAANLSGAIVTYSPNADFNGNDSFTFRANDGKAYSDTATALMLVVPLAVVLVDPAVLESPAVGQYLNVSIKISQANNVAGYQFTLEFDNTALEYVTIVNADFLPTGAFAIPPKVNLYAEDGRLCVHAEDDNLEISIEPS